MSEKGPIEEAMEESERVLKPLLDMSDELMPTFYGPSFPGPSVDKNGHIFVTLEFVPTSERSPDTTGWRYVLVDGIDLPSKALWEQCDLPDRSGWCEWKKGQRYAINWKITHWAEIPEMQNAD